MKSKHFTSESEMAKLVVDWLIADQWTVYQEVTSGGSVADIVAVRGSIVWVIECKLRYGLEVLEQAIGWSKWAHFVSVAAPPTKGGRSPLLRSIQEHYGVGELEVGQSGVIERRRASLHRKSLVERLRRCLLEEQKTFAPAGNNHGLRFTPFMDTCQRLSKIVASMPGIDLKSAIEKTTHHYSSNQSARCSLSKWIEKGMVAGVTIQRQGTKALLYPASQ